MKIKKVEFENFRNFKEKGVIRCSTDGKMTIIYGKNGDGKTTLHQLFQWIIYGKVKFNKTTSDYLYNLEFESEQEYGQIFEVFGSIDFEHNLEDYSIVRKQVYKKGIDGSDKIGEEISLQKMDKDYNWKKLDYPQETIEKLLPSGLAEYFFFDGESMIADLRVKGKESATKLRKALYSMFDLDVIESAIDHIGRVDLKTTVLGKLYLSKGTIASGSQISAVKTNIENAQNMISDHERKINNAIEEKSALKDYCQNISEKIGATKSKETYELQRKGLINQRDQFLINAKNDCSQFGDSVMEMFPQLLISKAVYDAKGKLNLKVNSTKLPFGINKRLIAYLLNDNTKECICGNPLCEKELGHIKEYLSLLPPKSYASLYSEFTKTAAHWGNGYDKEKIENIIKRVLDNQEYAASCDKQIKELDEEIKQSKDVEDLIIARQKAEEKINDLEKDINTLSSKRDNYKIYLKQQMKEFDKLTNANEQGQLVAKKIAIMEETLSYFVNKLSNESEEYSEKLQINIQELLNQMLTSKREVEVSKEFSVRVMDSHKDESKSEGQFAVVSFAYIGGILKMLKDYVELSEKEYPLVLDGPFSKLDEDQRSNVVRVLPEFAPQVILFSKDDLHDVINQDYIGKVWTIVSNSEKNVARIEEGKLWK